GKVGDLRRRLIFRELGDEARELLGVAADEVEARAACGVLPRHLRSDGGRRAEDEHTWGHVGATLSRPADEKPTRMSLFQRRAGCGVQESREVGRRVGTARLLLMVGLRKLMLRSLEGESTMRASGWVMCLVGFGVAGVPAAGATEAARLRIRNGHHLMV